MKAISRSVMMAGLFAVTWLGRSGSPAALIPPAANAHTETKPPHATTPTAKDEDETKRLQRVQALKDPVLPGDVPAYYTPGYEDHAHDLQKFLEGERAFVKKELGVDVPLSLALLIAFVPAMP